MVIDVKTIKQTSTIVNVIFFLTKRKVKLKINTKKVTLIDSYIQVICITYIGCAVISYQSCSCISYNNILSLSSSSYLHVYHLSIIYFSPSHTFIFIHFIEHSFPFSGLLLLLWFPLFVVGPPTHIFCLPPFRFIPCHLQSIHDLLPLSSCATGRPVQHGTALTSCTTTFWISPAWTLWAAVAASPGQRPRRIYQRTRIMTVYGQLIVIGWALFLVRAPTSPTKTKPSPHSSCFKWLLFISNLFIYLSLGHADAYLFESFVFICVYSWFSINLHFIIFCRCVHFSKAVPCCLDILIPMTLPTSFYLFIYLPFGIYLSVLWKYDDVYSCCPHYRMYFNDRRCLRYSAFGKQPGRIWEKMLKFLKVSVHISVMSFIWVMWY